MTGIELIAQERREQIEKHGRTVERDVQDNHSEQMRYAIQALLSEGKYGQFQEVDMELLPEGWDQVIFRKMLLKPYKERLTIAGAFCAAEIDRLQAQQTKTS